MRLLDLYCGAGGAAYGYYQAGFTDIIGVDIHPQPNYPYTFIQADTLTSPFHPDAYGSFDLIHASPPCQLYSVSQVIWGREHPDLIGPTRTLLQQVGVPYVIENVPGAPLRPDIVLCGTMFNLRTEAGKLQRHRLFELSWNPPVLTPPHAHHGKTVSVFGHGGHVYHTVQQWQELMGMPWATRNELAEAIPPAYTQFIGEAFISQAAHVG